MRISETDWRTFKKVREAALERFYERVVAELGALCSDRNRPACERYRAAVAVIENRDRDIAEAFDDFRRSTAILQLALMRARGLVSDEEMSKFTPDVRSVIAEIRRARR
jgi:hypothetical protein